MQLGITHMSPSCECMLDDFRSLITAFETKQGSKVMFFPDRFQALHTLPDKGCKIGVIFQSYSALCDAFQIDTNERVQGAMRTKETKLEGIIAVQVTGLLHKSNHSTDCGNFRRAVFFLGQGIARPGQNGDTMRNVLIDNNCESQHANYVYDPDAVERDTLEGEYAIN